MTHCKIKILGFFVMLVMVIGCSSSEEEVAPNQPNQPGGNADPDKYTFDVKELVIESSQIERLSHQVDYFFIGGYEYSYTVDSNTKIVSLHLTCLNQEHMIPLKLSTP